MISSEDFLRRMNFMLWKTPLWEIRCVHYKKGRQQLSLGTVVIERELNFSIYQRDGEWWSFQNQAQMENYKMTEEEKRRWGKQGNGIMACNPVPWKDKGKSFMGGSQRLKKTSMSRAWYGVKASSTCNRNTNWYAVLFFFPPVKTDFYHLQSIPLRLGLPFPPSGDLPNPGIKPRSPALQADSLPSEPPGKPWCIC